MTQLAQERLIAGLMGVAIMEVAFAETVDDVKSRKAFGQALWDMQHTKLELAEAATDVLVSRKSSAVATSSVRDMFGIR
jgi:acyl-CoA dehydrogenase